jgi:hypothetical protein
MADTNKQPQGQGGRTAQDINKLIGGLNTDIHPSQQPEHTVRDIKNFVPFDDKGNTMTAINEDGTTLMSGVVFPDGFRVIGQSILNTDIIVVIADASGNSQVGIVKEDSGQFVYEAVAPFDPLTNSVPTDNKELGFTQTHPVDCVSRKLINGNRLLYYTDNNIPFGRIDLDEPPLVGDATDQSSLLPSATIPEIEVERINEGVASSIKPGVYQFVTRYITSGGGTTAFGLPTNPIPMVPTQKSLGVNLYEGDYNEGDAINKSITLEISNVDQQFDSLELVVLYYEGNSNIFKASKLDDIRISSETISYDFIGVETESSQDVSRAEIEQPVVDYSTAKCIEQKDNFLFLSNLSASSLDTDLLQTIANNVEVKYNVNEVPFSGRGESDVKTEVFTLLSLPFLDDNQTVVLKFSSPPASALTSDFLLNSSGQPSKASIEITDNSLILAGDEISIGSFGSQVSLTITAVAIGDPITTNEFNIGVDASETLQNITDTIANSPDVLFYFPTEPVNDSIELIWGVVDPSVNGTTVTTTSSSVTTVDFVGGALNNNSFAPDSVTVDGNDLVLSFSQDDIIPSDTLSILNDLFDSSSSQSIPAVPDLALTLSDSSFTDQDLPEGFTDYIEETFASNSKTYRRGEVYSLAFALVLKNGSVSPAFHIPGKYVSGSTPGESVEPVSGWPSYATGSSTGDLGTFVSTVDYPSGQMYPSDDPATAGQESNIRHHYIPELANEPHFRKTDNGQVIRVISLEFDFGSPIPESILDQVEEIIFLRENRDVDNNKSVFTQGLVINSAVMCFKYNTSDLDGSIDGPNQDTSAMTAFGYGSTEKSNLKIAPGPSLGNIPAILFSESGALANKNDDGGFTDRGFVFNQGSDYSQKLALVDQGMFYSPESILENPFLPKSLNGFDVKKELSLQSKIRELYSVPDVWDRNSGTDFTYHLVNYIAYGQHANFDDYNTSAVIGTNTVLKASRIIEENSDNGPIDSGRLRTDNRYGSRALELLNENNQSFPSEDIIPWLPTRNVLLPKQGKRESAKIGYFSVPPIEKNLYNIRVSNPGQYSSVSVAKYLPIARRKPKTESGSFVTNYSFVLGGDTFITKFGAINSSTVGYWPFNQKNKRSDNARNAISYNDNTTAGGITEDYPVYQNNGKDIFYPGGWNFKTNLYFFVESSINTNYRHRSSDVDEQGNVTLERNSYFPLTNDVFSLVRNHVSYLGNPNSYNYQYSFDNFIKNFFPLGSRNQNITSFENRTIYSSKSSEDDVVDSYRNFAINDYYDLPSNTGPIWDSFVHQNRLFLHTTKSLWRTSAEETGTLEGADIDDIVLGQARLFNQASLEMTTADGGHGGTLSQFGGVHTEIGYIFPDVLQGKIFGIVIGRTTTGSSTGTVLKELSLGAISTDMRNRLPKGIIDNNGIVSYSNVTTKESNLIDNPYLGIGISGGFDYRLRRMWLVKHGEDPFTLSYSTMMNNFFSYHDYQPNVVIPYDNRVFFVRSQDGNGSLITSEMHEMNIGNKGQYFGTYFPSHVEYIIGARIPINTMFGNIQIDSESKNLDNGISLRDDNFETIQVWTDTQNTGEYVMRPFNEKTGFPPSVQPGILLLKYRNDEYRLAIPRDSVIDNSGNVLDPNNLDQSAQFRERIKNTYANIKLVYQNEKFDINGDRINVEFIIKMIETTLNRNVR